MRYNRNVEVWEFSSQKNHLWILTHKMINRKSSFVAFGCPTLSPFLGAWFAWKDLSFPHVCHPDSTESTCLPLRKLKGIRPLSPWEIGHDLGSTSHWVRNRDPGQVLKGLEKWTIGADWPTHVADHSVPVVVTASCLLGSLGSYAF